MPSESNNSKVLLVAFLTVNVPDDTVDESALIKEPDDPAICWPSTNPWLEAVITVGVACVKLSTASVPFTYTLSTIAVAPEVLPVIFSPAEKLVLVVKFKWVNISISNKKCL